MLRMKEVVLEKLKSSFLENNIERQVPLHAFEILELEGDIQVFLITIEKNRKIRNSI